VGVESFALVGHDWGGAISWPAALRNDPRLAKLAIVNAPHPFVFQKSLIEDEAQRAASQYINWFRTPGAEKAIEAMGFDSFFQRTFAGHTDLSKIPEAEKQQYLADWSQPGGMLPMLNWYRATKLVVPPPGIAVPIPDVLLRAFPKIHVPTLVIWGMRDPALLPIQLEGLDELVDDLCIVKLPRAGHFAPWEAGEEVADALRDFLA
jgi:pimeloyl-ACP methyl ester carboxylesterase